jgi:hypothetical protein
MREDAGEFVIPHHSDPTEAVSGGDPIWLRLEDKDRRGLAASRIDLRSLVESKDDAVRVRLPGRREAARIRLALSAGEVAR